MTKKSNMKPSISEKTNNVQVDPMKVLFCLFTRLDVDLYTNVFSWVFRAIGPHVGFNNDWKWQVC